MAIYFENLTIELHVHYVLKIHVNFMSIECYLQFNPWTYFLCIILDYKMSKFKNLIDGIAIDFLSSWKFSNMEDIRRKCNLIVNLS